MDMLFFGGYNFETPPPEVGPGGKITVNPPTGARTLNARATGSKTTPGKGWNVLLRLYSPLEPFFTKEWRPSEIELVE
jgi:hypothetical protein